VNRVREQNKDRAYRTEIPNLVFTLGLSPYELALYIHLKRTAGDDGECWKKTETLADETGMSMGMVSKAKEGLERPRAELNGKALIVIHREANPHGGKPKHTITIVDIWPENVARFYAPISQGERATSYSEIAISPHENAISPGEIKKEPLEQEEPSEKKDQPPPQQPRAREGPRFAHAVHPAIQVYREVFNADPPAYGQDQITRDVSDLGQWREVCEQWKGNNNFTHKTWNMVDAYKKRVQMKPEAPRARHGPRRSNVESSMDAVRDYIAEEEAKCQPNRT
jgi:hypothetical protein